MSIRVIRPGLMTTIQDMGRIGMQQYGVIVSGAMDSLALRLANLIVSNLQSQAAMELTLSGPSLLFEQDALIALCGGNLSPQIGDRTVPMWRPVFVPAGSRLDFGKPVQGCRTYLTVAGGFDVPPVMHSRSTDVRARLGGFLGRALAADDCLIVGPKSQEALLQMQRLSRECRDEPFTAPSWFAGAGLVEYSDNPTIRVTPGRQFDWFTVESQRDFFTAEFLVTSQSDRMGYRLAGTQLRQVDSRELLSEAVTMGTIQIPGNGQPIILMADRPTTGGYAKIAQVATVDLPVLAQVRPGSRIRFQPVSVEQSQELYRLREAMIRRLDCGLGLYVQ